MRRWIGHHIGLMLIMVGVIMMTGVVQVYAAEGDTSGKCGDSVTWNYVASTKTLTLNGSGDTYDYVFKDTPFIEAGFYGEVQNLIVGGGITKIGRELFKDFSTLKSVSLPQSVKFYRGVGIFWM